MTKEELKEAIRCCRNGMCSECPVQDEFCDDLIVDTAEVPVELLDRIEEELADE